MAIIDSLETLYWDIEKQELKLQAVIRQLKNFREFIMEKVIAELEQEKENKNAEQKL